MLSKLLRSEDVFRPLWHVGCNGSRRPWAWNPRGKTRFTDNGKSTHPGFRRPEHNAPPGTEKEGGNRGRKRQIFGRGNSRTGCRHYIFADQGRRVKRRRHLLWSCVSDGLSSQRGLL